MENKSLLLGVGKTVITPPLGTMLSGYGHRETGAQGVLDELEARVFWFREVDPGGQEKEACVVCADIIGFGQSLTAAVRDDFRRAFGLPEEALLLAASHTHSGPQTIENLPSAGGPLVPEYIEKLRSLLVTAAEEARASLVPITLHQSSGELSGFATNRRLLVDGQAQMLPNPAGIRDDEVGVIIARDEKNGSPRAVLFHYTCHTTTMGGLLVSADYAGRARTYVEQELGVPAGFLPGCFGDVRPNCCFVGNKHFRPGTEADLVEFGKGLGGEVVRVVAESIEAPTLRPSINGSARVLDLPLQAEPRTAPLTVQRLDLAEELTLVAMGAEMGVDYGHFLRKLGGDRKIVPMGYSNGLIAYVAPEYQFAEGGYEPDTFHAGFSLPSPFKPEIEALIHGALRELMA